MTTRSTLREGVGIGFRMAIADALLSTHPCNSPIDFVEVHPENYIRRGGRCEAALAQCRERWPVLTHGLTMCFGALEPFDGEYMRQLRWFLNDIDPPWHSDHLAFGNVGSSYLHDLFPLPFTSEAERVVTARVHEAANILERPIAIENVSSYAKHDESPFSEAEFLGNVLERADAKLLLDVNNVIVNAMNHGFDPRRFIDQLPVDRVVQIHVAGHELQPNGLRIDTHAEPVCEDVYELLEYTLRKTGPRPILLERDSNFPSVEVLLAEVATLHDIRDRACGESCRS